MRYPTCRHCTVKDGNTKKARDVYVLSVVKQTLAPDGYHMKCRRCGWSWFRETVPSGFDGLAEAYAALAEREKAALIIQQAPSPLPFQLSTDVTLQVEQIAAMFDQLPADKKALFLLAISSSTARALSEKQSVFQTQVLQFNGDLHASRYT